MRNPIPRLPWQDIIVGKIQDEESSFGRTPEFPKEMKQVDPNNPMIIRIYNEAIANIEKYLEGK